MAERSRRLGITQDRVVEELARLAFADIRDFASWDEAGVRLRPSAELGADQTACVAEIVENAGKSGKGLRVKLYGKTQALAALARHLGGRTASEQAPSTRPLTVVTYVPEPALPPRETLSGAAAGEAAGAIRPLAPTGVSGD
jgi:phage terminase small subunit